MESFSDMLIIRVENDQHTEVVDQVATEIAVTLVVNDQVLVSLLCSPLELDAMAVGFLLSEGILTERDQLEGVDVDQDNYQVRVRLGNLSMDWKTLFNRKTITSGCGQGVTFTETAQLKSLPVGREPMAISSAKIRALFKDFRNTSELYLKTGGVHSAALATADQIILFAEDIGRHNAVDKLIGKAFMNNIPMHDKFLLSSGRISGEIMTKVIRNQIPVLITRTAPTCMSINNAEDHGVTLIGFARGNRMNIYTHPLGVCRT